MLCKKLLVLLGLAMLQAVTAQNLPFVRSYDHQTGLFNQDGAIDHAYSPSEEKLFVLNSSGEEMVILDVSDIDKIFPEKVVDLSTFSAVPKAIDVYIDIIAVSFAAPFLQGQGKLVFFDSDGDLLNQFVIGSNPRDIAFSPNGRYLISANEAPPSDDYTTDPKGSLSILQLLSARPDVLSQNDIFTVDFSVFDSTAIDPLVHIHGNGGQQPPSRDLEPWSVGFDDKSNTALISLPSNNAMARVNYTTFTLDSLWGLPFKDLSQSGYGLDASDSLPQIKIQPYPNLFSLYQPLQMAAFADGNQTFTLTANGGTTRNNSSYQQAQRVKTLNLSGNSFPNRSTLQRDSVLGRLEVAPYLGISGFSHDSLVCFGGRSFSLWDSTGQLVWDSGDEIEQTLAQMEAANFNSRATSNNSFKQTSPERGARPNALATGEVDGQQLAFIGLEEMGGIMIYNIDDPQNPSFESYILERDFSLPTSDPQAGDLGPRKISFVHADDSPNGIALVIVSNAVSGNTVIYQAGEGIGLPEEEELEFRTSVYPNPSSGIFHTNTHEKLRVFTMNGQLVQKVDNQKDIDLRDQPAGFYLVKDAHGRALKIVKQ